MPKHIKLPEFIASTWQTEAVELAHHNPFPLWLGPTNDLQKNYQAFSQFVQNVVDQVQLDNSSMFYEHAVRHLDRGTSSCHLYWLSNWPWWHPDLVQAGATELVKAVRTLPVAREIKNRAETLYHEFIHAMWLRHWSGEIEKNWTRYNDSRQQLINSLPKLG